MTMEPLALLDADLNRCFVCLSELEVTYSEQREAWIVLNAIFLDGYFYHPYCYDHAWDHVPNVVYVVSPHLAIVKVEPRRFPQGG